MSASEYNPGKPERSWFYPDSVNGVSAFLEVCPDLQIWIFSSSGTPWIWNVDLIRVNGECNKILTNISLQDYTLDEAQAYVENWGVNWIKENLQIVMRVVIFDKPPIRGKKKHDVSDIWEEEITFRKDGSLAAVHAKMVRRCIDARLQGKHPVIQFAIR